MKNSVKKLYDACGYLLGTIVIIFCLALVAVLVFGIFCLEGWIFMLLWNWLAVALFDASALGYWVCVGIVFAFNFMRWVVFGFPMKRE